MPVTLVAICSLIEPNHEKYNPAAIAENYWALHIQKRVNLNLKSYGKIGMM